MHQSKDHIDKYLSDPKVIGLTGGIGSGKSTFSQLCADFQIPTIDTDIIAREVVTPNSLGLNAVTEQFGPSIINRDGTLNRAKLREIIFNDPSAKKQLEAILHPLIQEETQQQLKQIRQNTQPSPPFILVAIPLLTEGIQKTGLKPNYLDEIWVMDTSVEQQLQQASHRDSAKVEQIQKIINQQASREDRLKIADVVIHNNGDLQALKDQVKQIIGRFQK